MRLIAVTLLLATLTFAACNKKTAPPATAQKTDTEKKAGIDDFKSKPVQAKQLPDDKKKEAVKSTDEQLRSALTEQGSYKSYYESGYEKHNSGDLQGAINDFTKSIEANPQFSDAYNFRAMSRHKSGDKAGACDDWKKAAELGNAAAAEMVQRNCK